jgi:hypothetical protein
MTLKHYCPRPSSPYYNLANPNQECSSYPPSGTRRSSSVILSPGNLHQYQVSFSKLKKLKKFKLKIKCAHCSRYKRLNCSPLPDSPHFFSHRQQLLTRFIYPFPHFYIYIRYFFNGTRRSSSVILSPGNLHQYQVSFSKLKKLKKFKLKIKN